MKELQRTDEWWRARRGKITSSRVARVVNGSPRGWETLARELAEEMKLDRMPERYLSADVERGRHLEPQVIANAALDFGFKPRPVGFVQHPKYPYIGASSDFLVRPGRGKKVINGEGKAPKLAVHMTTVMNRRLPEIYKPQVQLQMEVHGADLTYFISYCPDAPDWRWRTVKIEVERDQRYIDYMLERCHAFWRFFTFADEPAPLTDLLETF